MTKALKLHNCPAFDYRGQIVIDSRDAATMMGRRHDNVLRIINTMCKHFNQLKIEAVEFFIPAIYNDEKGEPRRCYYLTELGCEMVAHKQTGKTGTLFTAQYIQAFHQMKDLLIERSSSIWKDTRALTKEIRRKETDTIKRFVDYAGEHGSENAERYYTILSALADRITGIQSRDAARSEQLALLLLVEKTIAQEIDNGIRQGKPYRDIYAQIKTAANRFKASGI